MPVIENFKAFIRQGRAAKDNQYEAGQPQQQQGHTSRGSTSSQGAAAAASTSQHHSQHHGHASSTQHRNNMSHPAETTGRQPHAPIGSATNAANEVYHHAVNDKSASVAAISQAMASGQTTAGGHRGGNQAASAAAAAASSARQTDAQQYQKEAERIVEEERLASEKLPVYAGLEERFTLICKMGE
jgi:hypothetical protein